MRGLRIFKVLLGIGLFVGFVFGIGLNVGCALPTREADDVDEATRQKVLEAYGKLPLYFIENTGQLDSQVKYYTKTASQTIYFTDDKIVFDLYRQREEDRRQKTEEEKFEIRDSKFEIERLTFSLKFLRVNKEIEIEARGLQEGRINYLIGNDPDKHRTNIPTYKEVVYKNLYPGIDLRLYGNHQELKYDLIVSQGKDPEGIRFGYEGIDGLSLSGQGELLINTAFGVLKQKRPYIYQEIDGERIEVEGWFKLQGVNPLGFHERLKPELHTYGFEIASYNLNYPLIIDPTLAYSTYLGGEGSEEGRAIAIDSTGAAYITGYTWSSDFPTKNPYQANKNKGGWWWWWDAFVTKLSPEGDSLSYSTYLGGRGWDCGNAIAVDSTGAAYITGYTDSSDFPTQNPYQTYQGKWDAFVTKLSPEGDTLSYSTYLGGGDSDCGNAIAVDSTGAAYITGYTDSTDFPTQNPYQANRQGERDAFVTKLSPEGDSLFYSTYLGGGDWDYGYAIAVDSTGAAYITGYTKSSDFPTQNPYQANHQGGCDAFVTKLSPEGDSLSYSTYLGGGGSDDGRAIAVDSTGAAYITGCTYSSDFPTQNPYQTYQGWWGDAFVVKITPDGLLPDPPTNLIATAISSTQIELVWDDNSDNEDGFKIERMVEGGDWQEITTIGSNPTPTASYSDLELTPNTTYYYQVRAYNAQGNSIYSNEVNASTPFSVVKVTKSLYYDFGLTAKVGGNISALSAEVAGLGVKGAVVYGEVEGGRGLRLTIGDENSSNNLYLTRKAQLGFGIGVDVGKIDAGIVDYALRAGKGKLRKLISIEYLFDNPFEDVEQAQVITAMMLFDLLKLCAPMSPMCGLVLTSLIEKGIGEVGHNYRHSITTEGASVVSGGVAKTTTRLGSNKSMSLSGEASPYLIGGSVGSSVISKDYVVPQEDGVCSELEGKISGSFGMGLPLLAGFEGTLMLGGGVEYGEGAVPLNYYLEGTGQVVAATPFTELTEIGSYKLTIPRPFRDSVIGKDAGGVIDQLFQEGRIILNPIDLANGTVRTKEAIEEVSIEQGGVEVATLKRYREEAIGVGFGFSVDISAALGIGGGISVGASAAGIRGTQWPEDESIWRNGRLVFIKDYVAGEPVYGLNDIMNKVIIKAVKSIPGKIKEKLKEIVEDIVKGAKKTIKITGDIIGNLAERGAQVIVDSSKFGIDVITNIVSYSPGVPPLEIPYINSLSSPLKRETKVFSSLYRSKNVVPLEESAPEGSSVTIISRVHLITVKDKNTGVPIEEFPENGVELEIEFSPSLLPNIGFSETDASKVEIFYYNSDNNSWEEVVSEQRAGEDGDIIVEASILKSGEYALGIFEIPLSILPYAPTNLAATPVSPTQLNLTWQDNSENESGFRIERRMATEENYQEIVTVGANVNSYQDISLTPNTTYYYRVRAYNIRGSSNYSNETSAITPVAANQGGTISLPDGTKIKFPPNVLPADANVTITEADPNSQSIVAANDKTNLDFAVRPLDRVNTYRTFTAVDITTGKPITKLNGNVTITIPYPDSDPSDGIVDGTTIKEGTLRMFCLNEETLEWKLVQGSQPHPNDNNVTGEVDHLFTFALLSLSSPSLEDVINYPNPCYPDKGLAEDRRVKIANIPLDSDPIIHIYNIAGELVRVLDETDEIIEGRGSITAIWDCTNDHGEDVAYGVYIYLLRCNNGIKKGKIVIIR
ncbi:MAG: SBBP repeat-containing protein [bacterium]|nr:SBBP repeat-containing protein [bacterium]